MPPMAVPPIVELFVARGVHLGVVVGPAFLALLEAHLAEGLSSKGQGNNFLLLQVLVALLSCLASLQLRLIPLEQAYMGEIGCLRVILT